MWPHQRSNSGTWLPVWRLDFLMRVRPEQKGFCQGAFFPMHTVQGSVSMESPVGILGLVLGESVGR